MDPDKDHEDHMDQVASSYDVPLQDYIHGVLVALGDAGTCPGDHKGQHVTRAVVDMEPNRVSAVQTD